MLADPVAVPAAQTDTAGPVAGAGASDARGSSLRDLAIRSAGYLAGREAVGMAVRLAGAVVTMRAIGPSGYGIFSAAAAFMLFASALAQMGIEVFLIRASEAPSTRRYNEAFTFLLITSSVVTVVCLALTVPLAALLRPVGVLQPLRVLLLLVPINVLWAPAQACIERQFGYRRMGILEVGGDVVLYATAVPLALGGLGSWSLVAGYFAWQIWLLVGSLAFSGLRPRLAWSSSAAREMLRHGFGYSLSNWASAGSQVVVALVVGTFAGAAGVGYVNFSLRLIGMLNFTKRGVFRIGMVAVSRARNGGVHLARALEEGAFLVTLAAAAPFAAFGLVARWVVPGVFGGSWQPAVPLYVGLSIVSVLGIVNLVQCTVLFAVGKNLQVAWASLLHLVVLAVAAIVLVPLEGTIGFALASGIALVSTVSTHRASSSVAPMRYRRLVLPLVVLAPPMLAPLLSFPRSLATLVPGLVALALPATRRELGFLAGVVRTMLRRETVATGAPEPEASSSVPGLLETAGATTLTAASTASTASTGEDPAPPPVVPGRPAAPGWRTGEPTGEMAAGTADGAIGEEVSAVPRDPAPEPTAQDPFEGYWLLPRDAVTGAPNLDVMLARAGRLLGGTRCSGWPLMLAAFELAARPPGVPVPEEALRAVTRALREDLRFDDPVARVHPSTFVVATALVPGGSDGPEVASRLADSVAGALVPDGERSIPALRWSYTVTTAASAEEVDDLLRRVVVDLQAGAVPEGANG